MGNTNIKRIYVEKKREFDVEARNLLKDLRENLGISGLEGLRILNRYDVSGLTGQEFTAAGRTVFSEPPLDVVFLEDEDVVGEQGGEGERVLGVEYLPGQYDQRADSAAQCLQIIIGGEKPAVSAARIFLFRGRVGEAEFSRIKGYLINRVDSREASLERPGSLAMQTREPADVAVLEGLIRMSEVELESLRRSLGLAMEKEDLFFCRDYFRDEEGRDPTVTEIKMLDTYWSDHCRHTTFNALIEGVEIEKGLLTRPIEGAFEDFLKALESLDRGGGKGRDFCLMDLATMSMKKMRREGKLADLEVSGEINACSIIRRVRENGRDREWLILFKNETHNHPTEIEPFGGAATCLGGAIRDPLSGRAFVYQSMRVTGSGDPRERIEETLPGKLPQRKITTEAAHGFSSYGNQVGLATGLVTEIYHEGYKAKRMEVGAVIGAVAREHVRRQEPGPGDAVLLVGGRTGRDGIGGATGSSKAHTEESLHTAGAEVQKGNPPEERKLQRLFRRPEVTAVIKKCNDFGAGGVSVAVGELAEGVAVDLDAVPKKYEGLDGTEIALSESQERMAVVVSRADVSKFKAFAAEENLEVTEIARVTAEGRMRMKWRGKTIVDIDRKFLNTHGIRRKARVRVAAPAETDRFFGKIPPPVADRLPDLRSAWLEHLKGLNIAAQRGLVERFDSTVGGGTVLFPLGGRYQATPIEAMAAKVPVLSGDTSNATLMSHGFDPRLSGWSPFHGGVYAVVEAAAKIVAAGGDYAAVRCSLQEYFEKLGDDPERWGKPFAALLGAYRALCALGIAAIGGKDSMSGSFEDLDVPPTLVAFAVDVVDAARVISPEFKKTGSRVVYVPLERDGCDLPRFDRLRKNYAAITEMTREGDILSAHTVRAGGVAEAISKMAFGNRIGVDLKEGPDAGLWFGPGYGSMVLELADSVDIETRFRGIPHTLLGETRQQEAIAIGGVEISLAEALSAWEEPLEEVFPTRAGKKRGEPDLSLFTDRNRSKPSVKIARPRVLVTVFPGTNCEYETRQAFESAGGVVETRVFGNLTPPGIRRSLESLREGIGGCQILVIPGGFSAGDEPDGSGKFIAAVFRNPGVGDAVMELLEKRDGLILGICNGFQALLKLGLVPYGEIRKMEAHSPILTFNTVGRHVSRMADTRVVSVLSPWFSPCSPGSIHTVPVSHGEGRFTCGEETMREMIAKGQVATQYVDFSGHASGDIAFNPNGSHFAVEGITSPDGRVLGKMAHSERVGTFVCRNIPGNKDQRLFEAGVNYFK